MLYQVLRQIEYGNNTHIEKYGVILPDGKVIEDITDNFAEICAFVDDLNCSKADPVHIYEMIEDFLCEKTTKFLLGFYIDIN